MASVTEPWSASVPAIRSVLCLMAAWTRFLACCSPSVGDRAIVVVNDTEWLAMAVVGGDGGGGGGGTSGNCSCSAISVSRVDAIWDSVPYTLALERIKDEQIDDMYKE